MRISDWSSDVCSSDLGYLPYALERGRIPGAVVVVVRGGEVVLQKGYGYSDVAKRAPVLPETTLFRPGSVSKLFTWTAVMQPVEAGKIEIGRASCRDSVCPNVSMSVVAV